MSCLQTLDWQLTKYELVLIKPWPVPSMRKIIEVFRLYSSGLGAVPPYHLSPLSKLKNSGNENFKYMLAHYAEL